MSCESCVGGADLRPGDSCSVCGTHRKIIGHRKDETPQCQGDVDSNIPITTLVTRVINRVFGRGKR